VQACPGADSIEANHDVVQYRLEGWMHRVQNDDLPALHSLITGLKRDQAAVTAGLTLPWNSGAVEGQVCKIKLVKRQGYGRAKLDLRRRVLHAIQENYSP
jgi:transposase